MLGSTYSATTKGNNGIPYDNQSLSNVPKNFPVDALNPMLPSSKPRNIMDVETNQLFLEVATKQAPVSRIKKNTNLVVRKK
jgi:hypothetical protein